MIGYETRGPDVHGVRERDARRVYARLATFLVKCTDCAGPDEAAGVPIDRYDAVLHKRSLGLKKSSTLGVLEALIDELVRDRRPCRLDLTFRFLLRGGGRLLAYERPWDDAVLSVAHASIAHGGESSIALGLRWPFESVTEPMLRSHDEVFGALWLDPHPSCWRSGSGNKWTVIALDRAALVPPPSDPTGARLHAAVLEHLGDTGARLAYADWLTQQDDPLGEMLVIQTQLADAGVANRLELLARADELRAQYGHRWSRVLIPRDEADR